MRRLGPLVADLFLRASSGGRTSGERRVTVALPAFVTELQLTARYPSYLGRADEPLVPGRDTILIPEGTVIVTTGAASVPLTAVAWRHGAAVARLSAAGARFGGRLLPGASGDWRLDVTTADGAPLEGEPPELWLRVVPDSAPIVTVPVPGRDTTLPLSLRQPLVIDVRDDHGLSRLQVVSWRVSQTGKVGEPRRDSLDVSGVGDRAIVQGELDAERRGLLPGDTLRLRAEAWDNAPTPHVGRSAELALRLPSLGELRAATRAAARDLASAVDSVTGSARELGERTSDLAQERARDAGAARGPRVARCRSRRASARKRSPASSKRSSSACRSSRRRLRRSPAPRRLRGSRTRRSRRGYARCSSCSLAP